MLTFAPRMQTMEQYRIDLKSLIADETHLHFDLDNRFFAALEGSQIDSGTLDADLTIRKLSGFFELLFTISGIVSIPCDLCLDPMEQPIQTENRLVVKLGETPSDDDELVVVDADAPVIDVAWYLYEFIMLSIPIKHIHAPGKCNDAMTQKLKELSTARSSDEKDSTSIDPRWSALSKLKLDD